MAAGTRADAGRSAVLRAQRPQLRTRVARLRGTRRVASARGPGGRASPLCSAPAAARPRARAAARGRAVERHPAPLGHRNLGVTSIYLQGIDPEEIIETVHARRAPMIPASMELTLPRGR